MSYRTLSYFGADEKVRRRETHASNLRFMNGKTAMQENSKALLHNESAGRIEDRPN
jgi:hypothetical protein